MEPQYENMEEVQEPDPGIIVIFGTKTDIHAGLGQQYTSSLTGVPPQGATPDISKQVFIDWLDGIATSEAADRCIVRDFQGHKQDELYHKMTLSEHFTILQVLSALNMWGISYSSQGIQIGKLFMLAPYGGGSMSIIHLCVGPFT